MNRTKSLFSRIFLLLNTLSIPLIADPLFIPCTPSECQQAHLADPSNYGPVKGGVTGYRKIQCYPDGSADLTHLISCPLDIYRRTPKLTIDYASSQAVNNFKTTPYCSFSTSLDYLLERRRTSTSVIIKVDNLHGFLPCQSNLCGGDAHQIIRECNLVVPKGVPDLETIMIINPGTREMRPITPEEIAMQRLRPGTGPAGREPFPMNPCSPSGDCGPPSRGKSGGGRGPNIPCVYPGGGFVTGMAYDELCKACPAVEDTVNAGYQTVCENSPGPLRYMGSLLTDPSFRPNKRFLDDWGVRPPWLWPSTFAEACECILEDAYDQSLNSCGNSCELY